MFQLPQPHEYLIPKKFDAKAFRPIRPLMKHKWPWAPNSLLHTFQKLLREIPKWNKDIIEGETNRIIEVTQCDWLESLITAVFVSNTKILTAIKIKESDGKIDVTVPRTSHFIHRCYIEVAREIYKNPYYNHNICDTFSYNHYMYIYIPHNLDIYFLDILDKKTL